MDSFYFWLNAIMSTEMYDSSREIHWNVSWFIVYSELSHRLIHSHLLYAAAHCCLKTASLQIRFIQFFMYTGSCKLNFAQNTIITELYDWKNTSSIFIIQVLTFQVLIINDISLLRTCRRQVTCSSSSLCLVRACSTSHPEAVEPVPKPVPLAQYNCCSSVDALLCVLDTCG